MAPDRSRRRTRLPTVPFAPSPFEVDRVSPRAASSRRLRETVRNGTPRPWRGRSRFRKTRRTPGRRIPGRASPQPSVQRSRAWDSGPACRPWSTARRSETPRYGFSAGCLRGNTALIPSRGARSASHPGTAQDPSRREADRAATPWLLQGIRRPGCGWQLDRQLQMVPSPRTHTRRRPVG